MTSTSPAPVRALVAWLVILGTLVFLTYRNTYATGAKEYEKLMAGARSRMLAMLAVQIKSLETSGGSLSTRPDSAGNQIIRQMEQDVHSPEDKIRLAIMTGELIGPGPALDRLESLAGAGLSVELMDDVAAAQTIYKAGPAALSSAEADRLARRYGYIGQIALAYGVASNREPRESVRAAALRFTARAGVLAAGVVLLGLLSFGLFVAAIVLAALGKIRRSYVNDLSVKDVFLEDFALYLILFLFLGVMLRFFGAASLQWEWLAVLIIPVVMLWNRQRGLTGAQQRQALGWYRGRGWLQEAGAGIAGYFAGIPIIAVGCFITAVLIRVTGKSVASPVMGMLKGGLWHTAALLALLCIFAPVLEETMFRGALFHHLRRRWTWTIGALAVSLIFALMHPQGWVAAPALGAVAIVLAALREWRGSLIAPMAAHACNNFIVTILALLLLE
jgi:membrane protease YdiL (CAAX protease family)